MADSSMTFVAWAILRIGVRNLADVRSLGHQQYPVCCSSLALQYMLNEVHWQRRPFAMRMTEQFLCHDRAFGMLDYSVLFWFLVRAGNAQHDSGGDVGARCGSLAWVSRLSPKRIA